MQLFLLLGGNLGDRFEMIRMAKERLTQTVGSLTHASQLYETAPWGTSDQPAYLNQVIELQTTLSPIDVLNQTQTIEQELGRVRLERWGSRTIDIDLLYYDNLVFQSDRLVLPHPLLHERRFALVPLCDVAPGFVHPLLQQTNTQLLEQCLDTGFVNPVDTDGC